MTHRSRTNNTLAAQWRAQSSARAVSQQGAGTGRVSRAHRDRSESRHQRNDGDCDELQHTDRMADSRPGVQNELSVGRDWRRASGMTSTSDQRERPGVSWASSRVGQQWGDDEPNCQRDSQRQTSNGMRDRSDEQRVSRDRHDRLLAGRDQGEKKRDAL